MSETGNTLPELAGTKNKQGQIAIEHAESSIFKTVDSKTQKSPLDQFANEENPVEVQKDQGKLNTIAKHLE